MDHKIINLIEEIGEIASARFDNLVPWSDIKAWPVGETRRIGDSLNTKILQTEDTARFDTVIDPAGEFDTEGHWHDFNEECRVKAGMLYDKNSGRTWGVDEVATFPFGKKHIIANASKSQPCYLEVNFKNVTKNSL